MYQENKAHFQKLRNEILKDESFQLIQQLNIEKENSFFAKEKLRITEFENFHKINQLNHQINSIYQSSSWKITYPIRFLKRQIDKILKKKIVRNKSHNKTEVKDYSYWISKNEPTLNNNIIKITTIKYQIFIFIFDENIYNLNETLKSIKKNSEICEVNIINLSKLENSIINNLIVSNNFQEINYSLHCTNENLFENDILNIISKIESNNWIIFLNCGDFLSDNCLNEFSNNIINDNKINIIYADEDIFLTQQNSNIRINPNFKPNFNLLFFYSTQYINHAFTIKANLIKSINSFNYINLNTQFLDILLKSINQLNISFKSNYNEILHIPKILFHLNPIYNKINYKTARVILENSLTTINEPYEVIEADQNYGLHLKKIFKSYPLVSIIIPTRNGLHLLSRCITSIIEKTNYSNFEIIVVDNGSDEAKTIQYLKNIECNFVKIIKDNSPFNYSNLNNNAVKQAKGEFICLMNNDTEVISENWLSEMMSYAIVEGIGCVGAKLLYPNNKVQHGGVILGIGGLAGHCHWNLHDDEPGYFNRAQVAQELSAVTAACLVVKKSIYEEVGGLDPELAVAFNDVNFCLDVIKLGYKNIWTPFAKLYHFESATRGFEDTPEKINRFNNELNFMKNKWGDFLYHDPAYNINLCLLTTKSTFSLSF